MAWIEVPSESGDNIQYVNSTSIDVLGYVTRTNDGAAWTVKLGVRGNYLTPRFYNEDECRAFYDEVKSTLGI